MKKLAGHIRDYIAGRCSPDEVFQVETIGRLVDGDFSGSMSYGEVMKHGDFGLGTFVDLDGEMAAADGRFWHFGPGGHGTPVSPETQTPFAVVKFVMANCADAGVAAARARATEKRNRVRIGERSPAQHEVIGVRSGFAAPAQQTLAEQESYHQWWPLSRGAPVWGPHHSGFVGGGEPRAPRL